MTTKHLLGTALFAVSAIGVNAQDFKVTSFKIDNTTCYFVKGAIPGSSLDCYSQRCGGKRLLSATTNREGKATVRMSEQLTAAFILSGTSHAGNPIKGTGKVVFTEAPDFTFKSPNGHRANSINSISWEADAKAAISFQILKSTDDSIYTLIATLSSKPGNGNYSYQDNTHDGAFYKIAIANNDEEEQYRTEALYIKETYRNNITVFPTATQDILNIQLKDIAGAGLYYIRNQQGQVVMSGSITSSLTPINVAKFAAGIYYFSLGKRSGGGTASFVKL